MEDIPISQWIKILENIPKENIEGLQQGEHAYNRCIERNINVNSVISSIKNPKGKLIKDGVSKKYDNTYDLYLRWSKSTVLHIAVMLKKEKLIIKSCIKLNDRLQNRIGWQQW